MAPTLGPSAGEVPGTVRQGLTVMPGLQVCTLPFHEFSASLTVWQSLSLAYCELYLTLAAIFAPGRFRLELFETDASDVETPHDFVNPCHRLDSKGIRVLIR